MGHRTSPLQLRPGFWIDQRKDRGGCVLRLTGELDLHAAAQLRARRGEIIGVLGQIPGLNGGSQRKAAAYLDRFFADIASDASVQDKLLKTCVG